MATTDTATDYTINMTPLPLAITAYPTVTMHAKSCPKDRGGQCLPGLACGGCGRQWGGTAEGGILSGLWPFVDGVMDCVKSDTTLTATTMLKLTV